MRVLHVAHSAVAGGSCAVLLSLLRHAPSDIESACVFLEDGPARTEAAALGAPVALVETGRARQIWRVPAVVRRLRAAVRAHRADLVFAHVSKAHLYAAPAARLEGVPALWWQQEHLGLKPVMQQVAGRLPAHAVICSAQETALEQRRRFPRVPVRVVHLGIDPEEAAAELPPREHRPAAGGQFLIGVVGRLTRWKRVELALRSMPAILRAQPRARLRVIGGADPAVDPGYLEELRREAERLGVAHAVEFAGQVPNGAAATRELDLLVHCAEREPFGLVLVEAMVAGVPVVATDAGGPREIVRDGVDGKLLDPRDADALAAAICELASDPERRERMGRAARERALALFTAERMAEEAWAVVRAARPWSRNGRRG